VINISSYDNPVYQVEIYEVGLLVYDCGKSHPVVLPTDKPKFLPVSRKKDVENFISDYRNNILRKYMGSVRCWVKIGDEAEAAAPPSVVGGRKMTVDFTDRDGPWIYIRQPKGVFFVDLIGERPALEVIAEYCEASYYDRVDGSPRSFLLEKWKQDLRPGDLVDAQDRRGTWAESSVVSVEEDKSVVIHFRGWGSRFDEKIPAADVAAKIQPLYSRTKNWRDALCEDDNVEVNVATGDAEPQWVTGVVQELDAAGGRVNVKCDALPAQ
jgi:hypothetical protein